MLGLPSRGQLALCSLLEQELGHFPSLPRWVACGCTRHVHGDGQPSRDHEHSCREGRAQVFALHAP